MGSVRVCWRGSRGRSEFLEIVGSVCGQVVDDGTLHILAHEQHAIHVQVPTARFLNDLRGGAPRFLPWPRPARPLPQRGGHMTPTGARQSGRRRRHLRRRGQTQPSRREGIAPPRGRPGSLSSQATMPGGRAAAPRRVRLSGWRHRAAASPTQGGPEAHSPGADVAAVSPVPAKICGRAWQVPVTMWQGRAESRCRCGRGEPSRNAAGRREPSPSADVRGVDRTVVDGFCREVRLHIFIVRGSRRPVHN